MCCATLAKCFVRCYTYIAVNFKEKFYGKKNYDYHNVV